MNSNNGKDIVKGSTLLVFLKFTVPNVIGFIAMSSSSIVDGIFVGRYVSSEALAAVNIVVPMFTLVFGIAIMLTVGGAVRVGKYLGENNRQAASAMFSKVVYTISIIAVFMTVVCGIFSEEVVRILGANDELEPLSAGYVQIISLFFLFQTLEYSFSVFVRMEGRPYLASSAVILGAVLNFFLDWIFICKFNMGLEGAALGTGLAFLISFIVLCSHFFSKKCKLHFIRNVGKLSEIGSAAYNGSSELLSELSSGFVAFLFNWIMITKLGTQGVAAFTVINYTIWAGGMLCYAVGDSLVPLVSINYGARNFQRIRKFVGMALVTVVSIGIVIFIILSVMPEKLISLFLPNRSSEAFHIAVVFASYIKWVFFFNGVNIIFSAYFTAIHRPLESVLIAGSRGLVLPVLYLATLPYLLGEYGIYTAIPLADITTLFIVIFLWRQQNKVDRVTV